MTLCLILPFVGVRNLLVCGGVSLLLCCIEGTGRSVLLPLWPFEVAASDSLGRRYILLVLPFSLVMGPLFVVAMGSVTG